MDTERENPLGSMRWDRMLGLVVVGDVDYDFHKTDSDVLDAWVMQLPQQVTLLL